MDTMATTMPQVFTHEETFRHDQFGNIRVRYDESKNIEINLEDAARGLGFTQTQNKGGKIYTSIRWETVRRYLEDVGFPQKVGENAYIPEPVFYMLAMKANNEAAKKFQRWIAYEVAPKIRKHGVYMTPAAAEKIISDPDFIINLAQQVKAERAKAAALTVEVDELKGAAAAQAQQIAELQPKGAFYDLLLSCKGAWAVGIIAKDYGMKAKAFNQLLHDMGLQHQQGAPGRRYWLLTQKALDMQKPNECWTQTETKTFQNAKGEQFVGAPFMRWTQQGRIALYHLLKERGILPQSEQPHTESDASENN